MTAVRLLIQFTADSKERADEALAAAVERCKRVQHEPGCLQFEVFRSELEPAKYVLLELWEDQAALDVHGQGMRANPQPPRPGITNEREDYAYNRTR
jgi:quinol monooxygenase YgiN